MIKIDLKGVFTIDEAIEVLEVLTKEETSDGVGFDLEDGQETTVQYSGEFVDCDIRYIKKDLTLYVEVSK